MANLRVPKSHYYSYVHVHFHGHDPLQMIATITERILDHLCCPDSSVGTGKKNNNYYKELLLYIL